MQEWWHSVLERHFRRKPETQGWSSYTARADLPMRRFRTSRVAKLTSADELLFTFGATERGSELRLNDALRTILHSENLPIIELPSTSGSRQRDARYPGFLVHSAAPDALERVLLQVRGAVIAASYVP